MDVPPALGSSRSFVSNCRDDGLEAQQGSRGPRSDFRQPELPLIFTGNCGCSRTPQGVAVGVSALFYGGGGSLALSPSLSLHGFQAGNLNPRSLNPRWREGGGGPRVGGGRAKKAGSPSEKEAPRKVQESRWRQDGGSGRCSAGGRSWGGQGGETEGTCRQTWREGQGWALRWGSGFLAGLGGGVGGEWGLASQRTRSRPAAGIHSEARVGCPNAALSWKRNTMGDECEGAN